MSTSIHVLEKISKHRQPTIHVLGVPYSKVTDKYSSCAYSMLNRTFCSMMKKIGYKIIYYGTEGSIVECNEFVNVFSQELFDKYYKRNSLGKYEYIHSDSGEAVEIFNKNCEYELRNRITNDQELVTTSYCNMNYCINSISNLIKVYAHIGSLLPDDGYRIFPSKTWRSYFYGWLHNSYWPKGNMQNYSGDAVIYHYLDPTCFRYNNKKDNYVLYIGRLRIDKGLYMLLDICKKKSINLKIAGLLSSNVNERENFIKIIQTSPTIEYLGHLDFNDRMDVLSNAKCTCIPTIYNEPFGLVAIESMVSGTPVVTTDWGSFSEINIHGKTGFRCSYREDFINSFNRIDEIKPINCRNWVLNNFTNDVCSKHYDNFFRRILQKNGCNIIQNDYKYKEIDFNYTQDLKDLEFNNNG